MSTSASLVNEIRRFHPSFRDEELHAGLSFFELKEFQAREVISEPGEICEFILFVEKAVTRCYYLDADNDEKTIWMEPAKMFITDFESFIKGTPTQYYLQFYEHSPVWVIKRQELLFLYENYKDWALFGIRLMEYYHARILGLFTTMFHNNATANYEFIERNFGKFLQVAPLKDIASMLHLSPVSLSRIRAGKQIKKVIS